MASLSSTDIKGIWLLDKNESDVSNEYNYLSFGPKLKDGATGPTWVSDTGKNTFEEGQSKIIDFKNHFEYENSSTILGFTIVIKVE